MAVVHAQPDLWSQRIHVYAERKPMGRQLKAVYEYMSTTGWVTFQDIREYLYVRLGIGISEPGISARIRDLRKSCYGDHKIERRATSRKGIFEYRIAP